MKSINEVLTELKPSLLSDIRGYFWSINKLDTSSDSFISLCKEHPQLSTAVYLVNPNINNSDGSIFLDAKGNVVFAATFFANLLEQVELDFSLELPDLTKNHPLGKILEKDFQFFNMCETDKKL